MLKTKYSQIIFAVLAAASVLTVGAGPLGAGTGQSYDWQQTNGTASGTRPSGEDGNPWQNGNFTGYPVREEKEDVLTVEKEVSTEKLYTQALTEEASGETQKFTTVKRGTFTSVASLSGNIVYTDQKEVTISFPYGKVYVNSIIDYRDNPYRKKGDVLATIFVELDEIEVKRLELRIARLLERGETAGEYEQLKASLTAMQEAAKQTEIVMEEDGYILDREYFMRGTEISAYHYILANPEERLISVTNEGKSFRFGQKVTVTAQVGNQKKTGTGTVISATAQEISPSLAGTTAYIKLSEDSEELYTGFGLTVSTETIHMENVLLLPISTVYMKNGSQLVKLKDEYGLHVAGFSFGRKGTSDYWVIDGLKEGTEILVQ